jgi:hypothetical protein
VSTLSDEPWGRPLKNGLWLTICMTGFSNQRELVVPAVSKTPNSSSMTVSRACGTLCRRIFFATWRFTSRRLRRRQTRRTKRSYGLFDFFFAEHRSVLSSMPIYHQAW